MRSVQLFLLLITLTTSPLLRAQTLDLSQADIERHGIVFAPVKGVDARTGTRVPARVINSPQRQSTIIAPYAGILEKWRVALGEKVTAGTVLASLRSQQIVDIQQQWLAANTLLDQARFERQKDQQLFEAGIIAAQRLKQTKADYSRARFQQLALTEKLQQAGFNQADLKQLSSGGMNPGIYFIVATVDGRLSQRRVDTGDYLHANSPVAALQQSTLPWIRAQIPTSLAGGLQVGQALSIHATNDPLTLKQKDLQVNPGTQTLEILAEFNQPTALMTGQIVSLILPPSESGVLVPAGAVVHTGDETRVFVRTPTGVEVRQLELRPVGSHYRAQHGIAIGEELVVSGAALLKGMQLGLGGGE
jgi:RND family efflux transporter MFP subunit